MADTAIWGLNGGTLVTPTASTRFIQQATSAATASTGTSFAMLGGLEVDTSQDPTTGNISAAVGKIYHSDISGMTADRDFILPTSAQVGERVGIFIETGDDTYELNLKSGATGDLINGTDHSSTEWSRLFITNECVIFRCVSAGNPDWIVEYDGRIPQKAGWRMNGSFTFTGDGDFEKMTIVTDASELLDNADINDLNDHSITVRRTGTYILQGHFIVASLYDQEYMEVNIYKAGSVIASSGKTMSSTASASGEWAGHTCMFVDEVTSLSGTNAKFELYGRASWGGEGARSITADTVGKPQLEVVEVLP